MWKIKGSTSLFKQHIYTLSRIATCWTCKSHDPKHVVGMKCPKHVNMQTPMKMLSRFHSCFNLSCLRCDIKMYHMAKKLKKGQHALEAICLAQKALSSWA